MSCSLNSEYPPQGPVYHPLYDHSIRSLDYSSYNKRGFSGPLGAIDLKGSRAVLQDLGLWVLDRC